MSSTTQYTTFTDLYTGLLRSIRDSTSVTATVNEAKRAINTALHDMHMGEDRGAFYWTERRARIVTAAPYTTGTVTIAAAARTQVDGASTAWNTAVTGFGVANAIAGYKFRVSGQQEVYGITSVLTDTSLSLADTYTGDAVAATSYQILVDEYSLASDFGEPIDERNFSDEWEIPIIGSREFYRRFPRNIITGKPRCCTFITTGLSGTSVVRKILFYPVPDNEYSIPYRYVTTNLAVSSAGVAQTQLSADTDEPIVPLQFRHALLYHALSHWYRDRKDDQRSQEARNEYVDIIRRIRAKTAPYQDRPRIQISRAQWSGGPGWRRRPRYDVNNWFEELKDR